jgi:NAD(P) transhydrogenase subunit alpha
VVEAGAGEAAGYGDALYAEAGARLVDTDQLDWAGADVVLTVAPPAAEQVRQLRSGAL